MTWIYRALGKIFIMLSLIVIDYFIVKNCNCAIDCGKQNSTHCNVNQYCICDTATTNGFTAYHHYINLFESVRIWLDIINRTILSEIYFSSGYSN